MILLIALVLFYLVGGLPGLLGEIFKALGSVIKAADQVASRISERVQNNDRQ